MLKRNIVVVGASAGGVEALRTLVGRLPHDYEGTVLVALHMSSSGKSALPQILGRTTPLRVKQAEDHDPLEPGTILIAPPDQHLLLYDDAVTLSRGPNENGHRPAVDVLFRSAAAVHGPRIVAVVLSGALDDGAAGMIAVKRRGGLGIVQDPEEALYASMPQAAASVARVDHVLPVEKIADLLVQVSQEEVPSPPPAPPLMEMESAVADLDSQALTDPDRPGTPSGWSCPDCHGNLFEIHEGGLTRFRCRVGHAWSPDSLMAHQTVSLETALWVALRTLEEKVTLKLELGRRASAAGHPLTGQQFERQANEAQRSAQLLRSLIAGMTYDEHVTRPVESAGEESAS